MHTFMFLLVVSFLEFSHGQVNPCGDLRSHVNINLINIPTQMCGEVDTSRSTYKIRGGAQVRREQMPWMVRVYIVRPAGISACGGTLINERYVLTAAHCTYRMEQQTSNVHVFFPQDNYNLDSCQFSVSSSRPCSAKYKQVLTITNHESYIPITDHNDIALLRIQEIDISRHTRPICFDTNCPTRDVGDEVNAAGWGYTFGDPDDPSKVEKTHMLHSTRLHILTCPPTYDSKDNEGLTSYNPFPVISVHSQVCAGNEDSTNKGTCSGDSGGPLYYTSTSVSTEANTRAVLKTYQYGITSFGPPCVSNNQRYKPHHYTNIRFYIRWILDNMTG